MPRKKKVPEVIEEELIPVEEEAAEDEDIINDDGLDDGIELPPNAEEKLNELIELGKKKKNVLELNEIADFLSEVNLDDEQLSHVMDVLAQHEIDILSMSDSDEDIDEDDMEDMDEDAELEEEDVDLDNIEGFIPEGVSLEDPVRMYLKEIGKVPLLSADEEIELAQLMEQGGEQVYRADFLVPVLTGGGSGGCEGFTGLLGHFLNVQHNRVSFFGWLRCGCR